MEVRNILKLIFVRMLKLRMITAQNGLPLTKRTQLMRKPGCRFVYLQKDT